VEDLDPRVAEEDENAEPGIGGRVLTGIWAECVSPARFEVEADAALPRRLVLEAGGGGGIRAFPALDPSAWFDE
jgi:hypothetical protein